MSTYSSRLYDIAQELEENGKTEFFNVSDKQIKEMVEEILDAAHLVYSVEEEDENDAAAMTTYDEDGCVVETAA